MSAIERIRSELEALGYQTDIHTWPQGSVVDFDYVVASGSHKGCRFRVGISMQENIYPEYPPHWIHISPPIDAGRQIVGKTYQTEDGRKWVALSCPPEDFWDEVATKNMSAYLAHLQRFWNNL